MDIDRLLKVNERRKEVNRERSGIEAQLRELEAQLPGLSRPVQDKMRLVNDLENSRAAARSIRDLDEATRLGGELDAGKEELAALDRQLAAINEKIGELNRKRRELIEEEQGLTRRLQNDLQGKDWSVAAGDLPKLQSELVDELAKATKARARQWEDEVHRVEPIVIAWRELNGGQAFPSALDLQNQVTAVLVEVARQAAGRVNSERKG